MCRGRGKGVEDFSDGHVRALRALLPTRLESDVFLVKDFVTNYSLWLPGRWPWTRSNPALAGREGSRGPGPGPCSGRGPDKQNRDEGHAQQSGLRTRTEAEAPRGAPRGSAWGRGSAPDSTEAAAEPPRPDTRWEAGSGCHRVARGHWGRSPLVGDPRAAACSFPSRPLSSNVTYFPIVAVSLTQNYTTRLNARV